VADIFDEIQEDLRAERVQRLLKRYGWLIIAFAVLVVGAVIAWELHTQASDRANAAAASRYIAAINAIESGPGGASHPDQLPALDQLAASAPEGYKTLARLRAAGLKAQGGDLAGAESLWNAVAADPNVGRLLRDFAVLVAAQHELDHGSPEALQARLKPLAEPDNPWSALAREQLAVLDLRLGKTADARKALQALSTDFLAPQGVRARAQALLVGLGTSGTT
jgi:hypothetical protein